VILDEAIDRAWLGTGGRRKMTEEDRRRVAYHEAGHGLVALALPGGRVVHKLTIIPRGRSLGSAWMVEEDDRYTHSRSLLLERMAALLAGRAAEELVFGEPIDGAQSDLATVARLARQMVTAMGMSKVVGAINYASDIGTDGRPQHSEQTARLIDEEVRALVEEAGDMAARVLARSRRQLDAIADALMERETLTLQDVEQIVGAARPRA
jgi:cell division protease FtsH